MAQEFESFRVYKETLALTQKVFELLNHQHLKNEFEFSNQMKRAVLSISNNIAEGSEYNNNAQFVRFLKYAKGSCAEVRNMLNICNEIYHINTENLKEHCREISVQLSKFIDYLKNNDNKRSK